MSVLDDEDDCSMGYDQAAPKSKAAERAANRNAINAAESKAKPQLISTTCLVHLLGGQIVIGQIEHYHGDPGPRPWAGLRIKRPYEIFAIPPKPDDERQTNQVAIVKYGTAGGALPMCGVDEIQPGINAVAIIDPPREVFDHYMKALEHDLQC